LHEANHSTQPYHVFLGSLQVLNFRSMFIMADLGDEHTVAGCSEKVLVSIRAFPDGSFAMQPGFSGPGVKYRFEDDHGKQSHECSLLGHALSHRSPACHF
jgi:hypothetical protein